MTLNYGGTDFEDEADLTDAFTQALQERLSSRDRPDFEPEPEQRDRQRERIERDSEKERQEKRESSESRTADILAAIASEAATRRNRERFFPKPPPETDPNASVGDTARKAVEWYGSPLSARQAVADGMKSLEQLQKDAKALGLEPPKSVESVAALQARMNGQGTNDPSMAPYYALAARSGTTVPEALGRYIAAENYLNENPAEGIAWLARHYGVDLGSGDPGLQPFSDMARNSGTTLPEAVSRYVAAEQFLERDPVGGIRWLMANYGISAEQLA